MVDAYLRQSPLAHLHLDARAVTDRTMDGTGVTLRERPFRGLINLRGQTADPLFRTAVRKAVSLEPPTESGGVVGDPEGIHILWLGPDEWLVVTPSGGIADVVLMLRKEMKDLHGAVTDVSDSRTTISLSGPEARSVLMKGCTLDLHPRVWSAGRCAQTLLARAGIILHQTADDEGGPDYDIYVLRSFSEYLWTWLEDAAGEYGVRVSGG